MKRVVITAFAWALIAIVGAAIGAEATATHWAVGTWKLNVAMSKFNPGPAPKSDTRTYAPSAQGVTVMIKIVGADGKEVSVQTRYIIDGKQHPFPGSPDYDSITVWRVDDSKIEYTLQKGRDVVETGSSSVSKDGKVLTLISKGATATGEVYGDTLVFDRE